MQTTRLPPHDLDAERAVLGAALRDNSTIDDVTPLIAAEDFYADAHRRIFAAILALHAESKPADLVTLADELRRRGDAADVGGCPVLGELWDACPAPGNAAYHAGIVRCKAVLRRLALAGEHIAQEAYAPTGTADDAVEMAEREVFAIAEAALGGEATTADRLVDELYDYVDACHSEGGNSGCVPTGFLDLDTKTGGLHAGALVLLAARPSVGKTALGVGIAQRLVLAGRPVFFASLEQTRRELVERMACSMARVDSHKLRKGLLDPDALTRLRQAGDQIRRAPLVVDDAARQGVLRIAAAARRMKRRRGLAAVVIDYLQLIEPSDRRAQRYEQVGDISRRLKAMAKELAVPVVALCQLNRASEDRAGGRPRLADLRESGSLEMDADTVILMHRPEENSSVIELDVAKQRNGPRGTVRLGYLPQWTRFEDYDASHPLGG
jgi:replicative DNA helicase